MHRGGLSSWAKYAGGDSFHSATEWGGSDPNREQQRMGDTAANAAGPGADGEQQQQGGTATDKQFEQLPDDHPLVKRLEALKAENKDLKPKAKRADDIENASKTQGQKDAEKIAGLETEVASLPAKVAGALRDHLVELHSIDKDDAELFLTGDTPELLLKQVARLLDTSGGGSKRKNYVSKEGTPQRKPAENENAAFARGLFGASDD